MSAGLERANGYTALDVVKAAAGTVILALVLACVYGPADYYSPLVYLNAVLAGLMGWLIGRCGKVMLRRFRIDGKGAATLVAVAGALAGLWFSWLTYLWVLFDFDFEAFSLFANPSDLWAMMEYLSENPAWSIGRATSTRRATGPGLMYWGVWLVEGVIFVYAAAKECRTFVAVNKLCPQCGRWLRATGDEAVFEAPGDGQFMKDVVGGDPSFMTNIAAGDLRFLESLPRLRGGADHAGEWLTAACHACGACEGLNAHVTLTHSIIKLDKKDKPHTTITTLANMVEISPEFETALFHQPETEAPAPAAEEEAAAEPEKTEPPAARGSLDQ